MAIVTTDNKYYSEIASAIREKLGSTVLYKPSEMAAAILSISGGGGGLPEGYTELEYIRSSGTQYVDTGVKGNSSLVIRAKFNMDEEAKYAIIGYYASETVTLRLFNASGKCYLDFGNASSGRISGGTMSVGVTYNVEFGNRYVKNLDTGANIISGSAVAAFSHTNTVCVFGNSNFSKGKIYYCQIYDNGTLVRDYVPCRNPYGVVGLYDLVNCQFYGNSGTGAFTGVPIAQPELPIGYTKLNYIQSSGTQYINTGVYAQSGVEVVADWMFTNVSGSVAVIGAVANGNRVFPVHSNNAVWGYGYGSFVSSSVSVSANVRYNIQSKMYAGAQTVKVDGVNVASATASSSYNLDVPFFVFALNNAGNASNFSQSKLFAMEIYMNGTLVRDFVPCTNPSGVCGLYDLVNGAFYQNAGSGAFVGDRTQLGDVPVSYSVNTSTIGTVWQVYPTMKSVPESGGEITVVVSHSGWTSGTRFFDFTVTGATAVAVGGTATSSPALTPTNKQAQFTIELSDITDDIHITFTNVRG